MKPVEAIKAILGPSMGDMADNMVAFMEARESMTDNPPTFVLRSIHPEDGRPRYLAVSTDRNSKGNVLAWSPFWSVDPGLAFPFEERRDAACVQAQYGASCADTEAHLYANAVIVKRTSRLKENL